MSQKNKMKRRENQSTKRADAYLLVIDRKTKSAGEFVAALEASPYDIHRKEAVALRAQLNSMEFRTLLGV